MILNKCSCCLKEKTMVVESMNCFVDHYLTEWKIMMKVILYTLGLLFPYVAYPIGAIVFKSEILGVILFLISFLLMTLLMSLLTYRNKIVSDPSTYKS